MHKKQASKGSNQQKNIYSGYDEISPQIFRVYVCAGFLSDGTRELAGSYGVHDVGLALGWIQQAVAEFGGDPRQVGQVGWLPASCS